MTTTDLLASGILLSAYLQWSVILSLLAMPVMACALPRVVNPR